MPMSRARVWKVRCWATASQVVTTNSRSPRARAIRSGAVRRGRGGAEARGARAARTDTTRHYTCAVYELRARSLDRRARRALTPGAAFRVHSVFDRAFNIVDPDGR